VLRHAREQLASLEAKLAVLEKQVLKESVSAEQTKQQ